MITDLKVTKHEVTFKMRRTQAARLVSEMECYHGMIRKEIETLAADLTALIASHDPHSEYEGDIWDLPEEQRADIFARSSKRHEKIRDLCNQLESAANDASFARRFVGDAYDYHFGWQAEDWD